MPCAQALGTDIRVLRERRCTAKYRLAQKAGPSRLTGSRAGGWGAENNRIQNVVPFAGSATCPTGSPRRALAYGSPTASTTFVRHTSSVSFDFALYASIAVQAVA